MNLTTKKTCELIESYLWSAVWAVLFLGLGSAVVYALWRAALREFPL